MKVKNCTNIRAKVFVIPYANCSAHCYYNFNPCAIFDKMMSFSPIDHFTVVCSATWPVDGSEARVDLVLIQTSLLLSCKCTLLTSEQLVLHNKRSEVCIITGSTLASLPSKGQVTKQATVNWSILNQNLEQGNLMAAVNSRK